MRVTKLEASRYVSGRILVWLEGEDSPLRVTEAEVLSFSLCPGDELDADTLSRLQEAGAESSCRNRAALILSARPLSRRELIHRLMEKGETSAHAVSAADWLESVGVLNDLEYARSVVRHYSARGYGEAKLRQELSRRGICRELWPEAMEESGSTALAIDDYLSRKLRDPSDPKAVRRATDGLRRRGFSWEDIRAGLARVNQEPDNGY